jgi:hypothetical protein
MTDETTPQPDQQLVLDSRLPYIPIQDLHERFAKDKVLGNFWRSDGFKAAESVLTHKGFKTRATGETPAAGRKAQTMVHPLVAVEFFRWVGPTLHQQRLYAALFEVK